MVRYENGKYIVRTAEENAEYEKNRVIAAPTPNEEDAIKIFFEGLADGETNSIAKIRALAQEFLNNTK